MRRVGESDARLEVVLIRVPEPAMLRVGKDQSAFYAEAAGRNLRDRIRGVGRFRCRFDRAADGRVKSSNVAVVALGSSALQLISQTKIQREPASHLPVIMKKSSVVKCLVRPRSIAIDES